MGCVPERLFPDRVAIGVARLSVRNAGNLVALTEADTACGFAAPAVKAAGVAQGAVGGLGSMTFTVSGCVLDLGDLHEVDQDCNGVKTLVGGRVVVSGTKTIEGIITGNPANPVVPSAADAVTFTLEAEPQDFLVTSSDSEAALTQHSGRFSFVAQPHLGVSVSLGVCAVPTTDLTVTDLAYQGAEVTVKNGARSFRVPVAASNLSAQAGRWGDLENDLRGSITVWNGAEPIPTKSDRGLDPEYDAAKHLSSFACTPDLEQPLSYACRSLTPMLSEGAARLTVAMFGNVVSMVDTNTSCGFSSAAVTNAVTLTGESGRGGGSAVWRIASGCTIQLPPGTVVSTDCAGNKKFLEGTITVTGTKTIRGVLSGDPAQPVVPESRDPAEITLDITFSDATTTFSNNTNALQVRSGRLTGTLRPRVAKDTVTGACSVATPVVEFTGLTWVNADVQLRTAGNRFNLALSTSALEAQNGSKNGRTNFLDGTITVDGTSYQVPLSRSALLLDPDYQDAAFDAAYACTPNMAIPATDAECLFTRTVTDGAARLTLLNLGTLTSVLEKDTRCGFSSTAVNSSVVVTGNVGERGGVATWTITNPCTLEFAQPTQVRVDCHGVATLVQGRATVTGTKVVRGIRSGDPAQPIVPTSRDPAEITLNITHDNWRVTKSNSINSMSNVSGTLSGVIKPRVAIDTTVGACSVPTEVVEFSEVRYTNARATVHAGAKRFLVDVAQSALNGVNGTKDARSNVMGGTMTVDGTAQVVPSDGRGLDPEFNQQQFDLAFACTPNARVPANEAECSFTKVLAQNTARLLIQTAGTIGTMVNQDSDCGFEALLVKTRPVEVVGDNGDVGLLRWQINDCDLGYTPAQVFQTDCNGGELVSDGFVSVDAGRTVRGLRESMLVIFDSIVPTDRTSVEIRLDQVNFNEYSVAYNEPSTGVPAGFLVIHGGTLSATLRPVLGERQDDMGNFDVSFPVPSSTSNTLVQVTNLDATLWALGKQFNVRISNANLDSFNGRWRGRENSLRGTITVDGETVDLGEIPLKPNYDATVFRDGYMCTANLAGPIPEM